RRAAARDHHAARAAGRLAGPAALRDRRRHLARHVHRRRQRAHARHPVHSVRLQMKSMYIAMVALCAACTAKPNDSELATSIAKGLAAACPSGDSPADEAARNDCAGKLTEFAPLRDAMREPFIWGGQQPGIGYRLDMSTN